MGRDFTSKINENKPGYKETLAGWIPNNWDYVRAQDIAELGAGGTPSTSVDEYWGGDILWMRSGDLNSKRIYDVKGRITKKGLDSSSAFLIPKHSVLIGLAGQGKTRGTVAINEVELTANQSVAAFIPYKNKAYYLFLFYALERRYKELRRLSTGDGGRGGLNLNILGNLRFTLPPLPEQRKIAEILSTWDKTIELVGKQIEVKKLLKTGLMHQLLTGKIRFPGFGKAPVGDEVPDGWHTEKLSENFNIVKRKNSKGLTRVFTASGEHGLIDQIKFFNKSVAGKDLTGYYLLKRGEFAYNRSAMIGYPYGAIKRLDRYDEGALSTLYICFSLREENKVNSDFYTNYFEAGRLNRQLRMITQVGGRAHGLLNITKTDFKNVQLIVPGLEEQNRIAETLLAFDKEIQLIKAQEVELKTQKQGLMQKLLTGEMRVKV